MELIKAEKAWLPFFARPDTFIFDISQVGNGIQLPITVKFFYNFREATGKDRIEIAGTKDVRSLLNKLVERFGQKLAEQLYEPDREKLRNTVNILVNGHGIMTPHGLGTRLNDGDVVAIFPPVCGG